MNTIYLGVDVSKGYADFCFLNDAHSMLGASARFDDTPAGHAGVRQAFAEIRAKQPGVSFQIGVEASGGLERNWLRLFRGLGEDCRVLHVNPLVVKRFLDQDLHRNTTDPISARGIASYLHDGIRKTHRPDERYSAGTRTLYRYVANSVQRAARLRNELQSLLPSVHPDLVRFCRQNIPSWILQLLVRYPTVTSLSRARPDVLARIPYVAQERATALIAAAKESVAALRDADTGVAVAALASEVLRLEEGVDALKRQLQQALEADLQAQILVSIPGIGAWTATVLSLELGDIARFHSDAALVASAGLDPRVRISGDGERHIGISRAGRARVRAALYLPAQTAIRDNPTFAAFYIRLRARGKCHKAAVTACMAKLLRIAYACVVSSQRFDPSRHAEAVKRHEEARAAAAAAAAATKQPYTGSLDAPVTRKEATRRRTAAMPQVGLAQRERGPGAALTEDHTAHAHSPQSVAGSSAANS